MWIHDTIDKCLLPQMRRLYKGEDGAEYAWGARRRVRFVGVEVDEQRYLKVRLLGTNDLSLPTLRWFIQRLGKQGDLVMRLVRTGEWDMVLGLDSDPWEALSVNKADVSEGT